MQEINTRALLLQWVQSRDYKNRILHQYLVQKSYYYAHKCLTSPALSEDLGFHKTHSLPTHKT